MSVDIGKETILDRTVNDSYEINGVPRHFLGKKMK